MNSSAKRRGRAAPQKPRESPERELREFIAKFTPKMGVRIRSARAALRKLLPDAVELVYDNYNFFVIGYGPTERTSEAVFSLAAQASGLTLFFLQGVTLPDPDGLLEGTGKRVRSVALSSAADLQQPKLRRLMQTAWEATKTRLPAGGAHRLIIKSVSAKQRPRRAVARAGMQKMRRSVAKRQ